MLNDHAWKCSGNGTIGPLMSGGWRGSNTQEMMLITDISVYYGNSISTSLPLRCIIMPHQRGILFLARVAI